MKITNTLKAYIEETCSNLESNVLVTDLNKVLLCVSSFDSDLYTFQPLSNDLLDVVKKWSNSPYNQSLILMLNEKCLNIVKNDNELFTAQIVLPIFHNQKLDGLLIFLRTDNNYICTSAKPAITARNLVEIITDNTFDEQKKG